MTLEDLSDIYYLVQRSQSPMMMNPILQQSAAAFAAELATSPVEFVELYRLYYQAAAKANVLDQNMTTMNTVAKAAWTTLAPLLFSALDCPAAAGILPPERVYRAVRVWIENGKLLGFNRMTNAVSEVVANSTYTNQTGAAAAEIVNSYLRETQAFFAANAPSSAFLTQDGLACSYPVSSDTHEGELYVTVEGQITVASYGPKPPSAVKSTS
jgi:hypothetical protein